MRLFGRDLESEVALVAEAAVNHDREAYRAGCGLQRNPARTR